MRNIYIFLKKLQKHEENETAGTYFKTTTFVFNVNSNKTIYLPKRKLKIIIGKTEAMKYFSCYGKINS